MLLFYFKEEGPLDTSFGSGGLPDNLGNAIEDFNGPIALGDEVFNSSFTLFVFNTHNFFFLQVSQAYSSDNNLSTYEQQFGTNMFPSGDRQITNPNRQQGNHKLGNQISQNLMLMNCSKGRRGGSRPQSGPRPASNASYNAPNRPTHQRPSQVDYRQTQRAHSQQADFRVPSQQQVVVIFISNSLQEF